VSVATEHHRYVGDEDDDLTRWDETIFERCLRVGFNPFGSGPTPIFLRGEKHQQGRGSARTSQRRECDDVKSAAEIQEQEQENDIART
jgi:fatty acid desaturase